MSYSTGRLKREFEEWAFPCRPEGTSREGWRDEWDGRGLADLGGKGGREGQGMNPGPRPRSGPAGQPAVATMSSTSRSSSSVVIWQGAGRRRRVASSKATRDIRKVPA